jgi:hypothetical protein
MTCGKQDTVIKKTLNNTSATDHYKPIPIQINPFFQYSNTMELFSIRDDVLAQKNTNRVGACLLTFAGTQVSVYPDTELRLNFAVRFQNNRVVKTAGVLFQIFDL